MEAEALPIQQLISVSDETLLVTIIGAKVREFLNDVQDVTTDAD